MNADEWASALASAILQGEPRPTLAASVPDVNEALAYDVQRSLIGHLADMGPIVGYKSALTNEAARATLDWPSPMSGVLLRDMVHSAETPVRLADFNTGVIETEIGLRVGRRIDAPVTAASLPDFLAEALPMIELGDVGFTEPPSPLDLVAENTGASRFMAGAAAPLAGIDEVQVSLYRDHQVLHAGNARDAMGSVLEAGAWLVNHCLSRGFEVLAGHLLMTGSLGQIQLMQPGQYRADYGDFGSMAFGVVG